MARGKTDDEMLALSRANRLLEDLDDPRSSARIAHYLYLRFTSAGEEILPVEDRVTPMPEVKQSAQLALEMPPTSVPVHAPQGHAGPPTHATPTTPPATPGGPVGTRDGAPAMPAGDAGWNLSGAGSAQDDAPMTGTAKKAGKTKITPASDGGWDLDLTDPDAEVEVKI